MSEQEIPQPETVPPPASSGQSELDLLTLILGVLHEIRDLLAAK